MPTITAQKPPGLPGKVWAAFVDKLRFVAPIVAAPIQARPTSGIEIPLPVLHREHIRIWLQGRWKVTAADYIETPQTVTLTVPVVSASISMAFINPVQFSIGAMPVVNANPKFLAYYHQGTLNAGGLKCQTSTRFEEGAVRKRVRNHLLKLLGVETEFDL